MSGVATDTGKPTGSAVNDAYGTKTAAAGTEFTRVIPSRPGLRARASGFIYTAGTTAHTLTFMVTLDQTSIASEAASGQAVIVASRVPTAPDGSSLAAGDWVIVAHEDGVWTDYKVTSISGFNITLTANLAKKVLKDSALFFMGAPADHDGRAFTILASQTLSMYGADNKLCAATAMVDNQPILVHSNNITAAGYLQWLGYTYGSAF